MNIFVMRHGQAECLAPSDRQRKLTHFGINQARQQGLWLKSQNIHFDYALVSPYDRAQETFAAVSMALKVQIKHENWDALTPHGCTDLVLDYLPLLEEQGVKNLLIVSHLPLVGFLVYDLCHTRHLIRFSPATIAQINWDGNKGIFIQSKEPH